MAAPKKKKDREENTESTEVADPDTLKIRLEEAKSSAPVLVVISGRPLGKSFFLTKEKIVLGRDLSADISLPETAISRNHTQFKVGEDGEILVSDMGSTNGTFVNDEKVNEEVELEDGDLIRCGNTIFKYLEEGQIENVHYGKMYDLATRDGLTGAQNKKTITEIIHEEFHKCQKTHRPLTLVMFDIDFFKKCNDTYGHQAGDYVLKETCALIMNKMIRGEDVLGRYGGEEFALVLRETPLEIGVEVAERIRKTIEKHPYQFDDTKIPITISMGVVTLDSTSKSPEELIELADKALYDAKHQGRNRVCVR